MALTTPDTSAIVVVNGQPFAGWTATQITQSFDKASGDATLRMSPQPGVPLPIRLGDKVQVILAKRPVITGHVHRVWGDHDTGTHIVQAQLRDKTQDFIDSTIGPKLDVDPPISLAEVARKTLSVMGLGAIAVIDKVGAAPFKQGEKVSGAIDEFGHTYVENWARKRNAVLTTDGKGNLVIDQNQGRMLAGAMIHFGLPDDPLNNVQKSMFGIDDFDRHNTHAVAGQKSPNDRKFWESRSKGDPLGQAPQMSSRYGFASDPSVRKERRRHHRAGKGSQGNSPKETAKWRANTMRAKSNEYVATVAGFTTATGELWWPGHLVPVFDYWWNISATLFLKEVTFNKEAATPRGATTQLKFALGDAFRPQAGPSGASSRTSSGMAGDPGAVHGKVSPEEMGVTDPDTEKDVDE
jgi:prophage tail gpP-like protein